MRFRRSAFLGTIATCAIAAACIPELITDPLPEGGTAPQLGAYCGDGIITLGQYDGGFSDLKSGEACDPTEAGTIGCTKTCQIDCGDAGFIDPVTNHCYFAVQSATSLGEGESSADALCQKQNAHAVTFVDDTERDLILSHFNKKLDAAVFWINLTLVNEKGGYVPNPRQSEIVYEPGWASTCPGCYAPANVKAAIPKLVTDAGGNCVVDLGSRLGWSAFPCSQIPTAIPVLCEREPPGELWAPCNGGYCASVPQTAGKKRYLYSPNQATNDDAKTACNELAPGGSLVIFDSPEERETLLRELLREFDVQQLQDPPADAWIGLSLGDGGSSFTWDNGTAVAESPWGDNQPLDAAPPLRAYVLLASGTYDVQLAHVDTQIARPYICQY